MRRPASLARRQRHPAMVYRAGRALFTARSRLYLYEQLEQTARSGMREYDIIAFIWRTRTRGGTRKRFSPTTLFCEDALFALEQEGRTLPEVAMRWSGTFERPLLVAAALGGGRPEAWGEIARQLRTSLRLRTALLGLLGHAGLLAAVLAASAIFLAYYFVPQVTVFIDFADLQGAARSLVGTALLFRDGWPLLVLGLLLTTLCLAVALPRLTGRVRDWVDGVEPFGIYRGLVGGSFLTGMAGLFRVGLNERDALASLRRQASPYLAERIRRLERIDATFGERLDRMPGDWPDYESKVLAAFAARQADPTDLYARIGDELISRTVRRCARLGAASGWAANIALAAVIIWVLVATNDISTSFQAARG